MPIRILERLARMLPAQCAVCRAWPAQAVCEACVARFAQPRPRCRRCALPTGRDVEQCGQCISHPHAVDACHAAVTYGFPWAPLVAQFKFRGHPGWARTFATLMRSAPWVEPALDDAELVVPMPLSRERLALRGFNQSLVLAHRLAREKVDGRTLLRVRDTPAQSALDRRARLANVRGAFAVEPGRAARVRGRRVVLVDDVMTSGASLYAAAQALREAGASRVTALVFARTDAPA